MPWWNPFSKKLVEPSKEKSIQALIKAFTYEHAWSSHYNPDDRRRAAEEAAAKLAQIGVPAIAPLIAEFGNSNDYLTAEGHAVDALQKIGAPAVEPLLAALNHTDAKVRYHAVDALGGIGDTRAVELLIGALDDDGTDSHRVGQQAVWALGRTRDRRAFEPLMAALKNTRSRHDPLRGRHDPTRKLHAFYTEDVAKALGEIGDPRAVETLLALLGHDKDGQVAGALGKIGDARAVEPLIAVLNDNYSAAEALGRIGDSRAVQPLLDLAKSGADRAVRALTAIGDPSVLEELLVSAVKSDWDLASDTRDLGQKNRTLSDAILKLGQKNRVLLCSFLKDTLQTSKSIRVRRHAAELLALVGELSVKALLPKIILDWLEFTTGDRDDRDDGLESMADFAGIDSELLELATTALGHTVEMKYGSSSGGNFGWSSLDSYDGGMGAIAEFCKRPDTWSSCVLYRVSKKKDASVTVTTCLPSSQELKLSFEKERVAARQELVRRGMGDIDPMTLLEK